MSYLEQKTWHYTFCSFDLTMEQLERIISDQSYPFMVYFSAQAQRAGSLLEVARSWVVISAILGLDWKAEFESTNFDLERTRSRGGTVSRTTRIAWLFCRKFSDQDFTREMRLTEDIITRLQIRDRWTSRQISEIRWLLFIGCRLALLQVSGTAIRLRYSRPIISTMEYVSLCRW